MAQYDQQPRHSRQSSRLLRLVQSGGGDTEEPQTGHQAKAHDAATIQYIKRVLCARPIQTGSPQAASSEDAGSKPLEDLLPPLTSSNDVDIQLYAIIAVILNQFVQTWYNRITPDQDFVAEVVQIIAHCTRGVEQRLRCVDLEELLLDHLPTLLIAHVDTITVARDACAKERAPGDIRTIYHSINSHKALTPLPESSSAIAEQQDNELAWCQLLVSRIVPLVLPPEDLQNPCLHVLVSEVFSEIIVQKAICGRASEAWTIWEGVTKIITMLRPDTTRQRAAHLAPSPINKLEQFGLLSSAEATQRVDQQNAQRSRLRTITQFFWSMLQLTVMVSLILRSLVSALMHASSIAARPIPPKTPKTPDRLPVSAVDAASLPSTQDSVPQGYAKRAVTSMAIWTCISILISLRDRMPWLSGFLSLLQWTCLHGPGKVCSTNSALDRFMSMQIREKLFHPGLIPRLLLATRSALFPDYALAPTRQTPTSAEVAEIKRECARTIVKAIPKAIRSTYFATKDEDMMRQDVEDTLDLFADPYVNRHLIISAVELLVVRLFPELSEESGED